MLHLAVYAGNKSLVTEWSKKYGVRVGRAEDDQNLTVLQVAQQCLQPSSGATMSTNSVFVDIVAPLEEL